MRKSSLFSSAIVGGLVFVASCGSDSATGPTPASANLSAALSQTTYGDVSSFSSASSLTKIPATSAPEFDPSACTYTSSDGAFTCPAKTASGVTFQLKYFLYDGSNVSMSAYDPAVTSKLRAVWNASGTFTTTGANAATVQLEHHSDMTLDGLLGTSRTLNGTSTAHDVLDSGSGSSAVHLVVEATGTATNVVLPAAAGEFPASGLLASDVAFNTTSNGQSASATLRGTLAFNGTRFALLTISSGVGITTCTIDLTGGTAPRCGA
jgi:hypothetical protein